MPSEPLLLTPSGIELQTSPCPPQTVLSGQPESRHAKLLSSRNRMSTMMVWDCTPGTFRWHYAKDETAFVVRGEAFMMNERGEERRFAAGDVGFFPAGYKCTWRVTQTFRKIAVVKENIWLPFAWCIKACNKILSVTGLTGN